MSKDAAVNRDLIPLREDCLPMGGYLVVWGFKSQFQCVKKREKLGSGIDRSFLKYFSPQRNASCARHSWVLCSPPRTQGRSKTSVKRPTNLRALKNARDKGVMVRVPDGAPANINARQNLLIQVFRVNATDVQLHSKV